MNPDNPECNHHHQNESTNHQLVLSAHNPHDYTQQLPCFTSRTQVIHKGRVKKKQIYPCLSGSGKSQNLSHFRPSFSPFFGWVRLAAMEYG